MKTFYIYKIRNHINKKIYTMKLYKFNEFIKENKNYQYRYTKDQPTLFDLNLTKEDYEKLNEDDIETLAENVCSIHKNILLVNYYKTFGLNVIDNSDGTAVVMEGLVGDVFDSC